MRRQHGITYNEGEEGEGKCGKAGRGNKEVKTERGKSGEEGQEIWKVGYRGQNDDVLESIKEKKQINDIKRKRDRARILH